MKELIEVTKIDFCDKILNDGRSRFRFHKIAKKTLLFFYKIKNKSDLRSLKLVTKRTLKINKIRKISNAFSFSVHFGFHFGVMGHSGGHEEPQNEAAG